MRDELDWGTRVEIDLVRERIAQGARPSFPAAAFGVGFRQLTGTCRYDRQFAERLREAYGKLPLSGQPRISRMKAGQRRFTVVDVHGNSLIFIEADTPDSDDEASAPAPHSSLGRALTMAARLRDFKNDDVAAAKVLDVALRRTRRRRPWSAFAPWLPAQRLRTRSAIGSALAHFARRSMGCH